MKEISFIEVLEEGAPAGLFGELCVDLSDNTGTFCFHAVDRDASDGPLNQAIVNLNAAQVRELIVFLEAHLD